LDRADQPLVASRGGVEFLLRRLRLGLLRGDLPPLLRRGSLLADQRRLIRA
jgi:hypothetical protein